MKKLIQILIASALVLGFNAMAAGPGSGAFTGNIQHQTMNLAAGPGSGAFGGG